MLPRWLLGALALFLPGQLNAQDLPALPSWSTKQVVDLGKAMDCSGKSDWTHKTADFDVLVRSQKEILARGRDRLGLAWSVQAAYPGDLGCWFFAYDLDKNGSRDLIFLTANGGSGPAGITMTVIAFDKAKRPVPWQGTGPFVFEGERLFNFIDLDGDKKAELLFQYVEEFGKRRQLGVSTALYRIVDGYFSRVTGVLGGRTFPIRQPTQLPFEEEPDLTNALPVGSRGEQITALKQRQKAPCWLEGIRVTQERGIALAPGSPAAEECRGYLQSKGGRRVSVPLIAVLDLPRQGRFIDINHSLDVVNQSIKLNVPVALLGRSCETGCRPFIMWARPRQPPHR